MRRRALEGQREHQRAACHESRTSLQAPILTREQLDRSHITVDALLRFIGSSAEETAENREASQAN